MMYKVFEYDRVKGSALSKATECDDVDDARVVARSMAAQWCEDEEPVLVEQSDMYEIYGGNSDFGALLLAN